MDNEGSSPIYSVKKLRLTALGWERQKCSLIPLDFKILSNVKSNMFCLSQVSIYVSVGLKAARTLLEKFKSESFNLTHTLHMFLRILKPKV